MPVFLCHKISFREVSISPAFILEGCGTREAVKKFRGHVFSRWFSITVSLLSALFAAAGLFLFLGGRHKLALYYAGSALLLLVFNLAGKAFLVRRLSSVLDQILGGAQALRSAFTKTTFPSSARRTRSSFPFITAGSTGSPAGTGSWPCLPEKISVFPSGIRTAARYGTISAGF